MHVEVTNGLQKEKSSLQLEAAKLARDVDLLRQAEALHLQRSSTQARCISGNSNKVYFSFFLDILSVQKMIIYMASFYFVMLSLLSKPSSARLSEIYNMVA